MLVRVRYEFDTEDGKRSLAPSDIPIFRTEPKSIEDGKIALYEFGPEVLVEDVFRELEETTNGCFSVTEVTEPEETPSL